MSSCIDVHAQTRLGAPRWTPQLRAQAQLWSRGTETRQCFRCPGDTLACTPRAVAPARPVWGVPRCQVLGALPRRSQSWGGQAGFPDTRIKGIGPRPVAALTTGALRAQSRHGRGCETPTRRSWREGQMGRCAPELRGPCGVPGDTSSSPPQRHCFRGGNLPVEASQVRRRVTCGGRCLPLFVLSGEHAPAFPFSPEVPTPSLDPDLEQDPQVGLCAPDAG